MSIHTSVKDYKEHKSSGMDTAPADDIEHIPRGWWDYVPEPSQSEAHARSLETSKPKSSSGHSGATHAPGNGLHSSIYPPTHAHGNDATQNHTQRQYRVPSIVFSTQHAEAHHGYHLRARARSPSPVAPSIMSRLSKYMPRMRLFREVLKNEASNLVSLYVY